MSASVNLNLPAAIWTARDSRILALNTVATIKLRTSKGLDADGQKFDGYSTRPITIKKQGARLKPKGGVPTANGQGVFYQGGYKEYKKLSRQRTQSGAGQSAEVDLVLSGQLMNNLVVLEASQKGFTIGLTKHVSSYGYYVNDRRQYIGLTNDDVDILVEAIRYDVLEKLK